MKEEKNKIGNIETLEKDSLSYTKNSKDLPTTFFKPIEEVQKTQQEILQNYKKEETIIENGPDLSKELRALEKKLNAKKFYLSPIYVLFIILVINLCWFVGVKFVVVPKYEKYVKESKEIKENYDYLKRTIDAIVGES